MVQFSKEVMSKNVWIIHAFGRDIPLEFFTAIIKSVAIAVFIYLAYNIGQSNAITVLDFTIDHAGGSLQVGDSSCPPYIDGNTIKYNCSAKTIPSTIPTNTTFKYPIG